MTKPLHPFLFATYFVLFLYSENQSLFPFWVVYTPILKILLSVTVVYILLQIILRDSLLGALITSILLSLLVFYGRAINAYQPHLSIQGLSISPQFTLGTPLLGLFGILTWLLCASRLKRYRRQLTGTANLMAIILCAIASFNIVSFARESGSFEWRKMLSSTATIRPLTDAERRRLPHIFHLVLDGYGSSRNLREIYRYDNGPFLEEIRKLGFYVADDARANYSHTTPAIASLLNYTNLGELARSVGEAQTSYAVLRERIVNNRLKSVLHEHGYRFVAPPTGFDPTEMQRYSDLFISESRQTEFERTLFDLTIAPPTQRLRERERQRIASGFDILPMLARNDQPLYIFAHILAPHPPFVFDADGKDPGYSGFQGILSADYLMEASGISREEYGRRYVAQLHHINELALGAIRGILRNSVVPPVIIIHGDHGPGAYLTHEDPEKTYFQDRLGILCAVLLPGGESSLYPAMTPVNALVISLNHVLGTDLPHIPDRSYLLTPSHPYRYWDVTDQIGSEADKQRFQRLIAESGTHKTQQATSH